jgi:hypothetical protein
MLETIHAGTVLFRDGTIFPGGFRCESESYSPGWRSVQGLDGYGRVARAFVFHKVVSSLPSNTTAIRPLRVKILNLGVPRP